MQNNAIPLSSDFKVIINDSHLPKELSPITKKRIEEIWKQEVIRTRGKVFNGQLLSADHFKGNDLEGHFVEYKHYLAQLRDPTLTEILNINPICVCAFTTAENDILVGKRADHVTAYPNFFELVPAGGIDPSAVIHHKIDIIHQLKIELKEEAGIDDSLIKSILPTYLIPDSHTFEICAQIELEALVKNRPLERDEEYTELLWISKNEMDEFIIKHQEMIIPLSLQIYKLFTKEKK